MTRRVSSFRPIAILSLCTFMISFAVSVRLTVCVPSVVADAILLHGNWSRFVPERMRVKASTSCPSLFLPQLLLLLLLSSSHLPVTSCFSILAFLLLCFRLPSLSNSSLSLLLAAALTRFPATRTLPLLSVAASRSHQDNIIILEVNP